METVITLTAIVAAGIIVGLSLIVWDQTKQKRKVTVDYLNALARSEDYKNKFNAESEDVAKRMKVAKDARRMLAGETYTVVFPGDHIANRLEEQKRKMDEQDRRRRMADDCIANMQSPAGRMHGGLGGLF